MSTRQGIFITLRDTAMWVFGWVLMFKEAGIIFDPPAQVSDTIVLAAVGLTGGPGMLHLLAAILGRTGTVPPPSDSPRSALPLSSPGAPSEADP